LQIKNPILVLSLFLSTSIYSLANVTSLDSLKLVINSDTNKATKIATFNLLIAEIPWESPDSTLFYCSKFLDIPNIEQDKKSLANIEYYRGRANRSKGNYTKALEHFGESHDLYTVLEDEKNIAKAAYQIGIINLFIGKMEKSLEHLTKSYNLYEKVGDKNDIADLHNGLASYYSEIGQNKKAINKYKKALDIYIEVHDSLGMANAHANLGLSYIDEDNYAKAEFHILKQGHIDTLLKTEWGLGFHNDYMGYLRQEEGKLDEALLWYQKALNIRKKQDSHYNLCESNLSIGSLYTELKEYEKAIPYLQDIFKYKEVHQSLSQEERAHHNLSECYEKLNQYALALDHYKKYKETTDSIYQEDKIESITTMETAINKAELDKEIAILNSEKIVNANNLKQQKTIAIIGIASAITFLLFGLWIYSLYKQVQNKNLIIEKALREKDILLREIHHRVKNNLQIISSVLSLQSRQITDTHIQQAINEGRNRVRSMALIHQNLYQKENLTGVSVVNYLKKLVSELFHTYNISSEEIDLKLDISPLELDVDIMIPLGLIINELVSNSLKHAFTGVKNGVINISLKEENQVLILVVEDNGVGVSKEEMAKSNSFGNRLIKAFSQKLKANYTIINENGTKVRMTIKNYLKAA